MAIFFAVTAVALAALLLRFLWREIGSIREEFFQKARCRSLKRLGVVATAGCLIGCAVIAVQAVMLDRHISSERAAATEVDRLRLELARLQLTNLAAAAAKREPEHVAIVEETDDAPDEPAVPSPGAPKQQSHAYVAANSVVVRAGPGKDRLFALQRGAPVTLRGDAREVDGREWQEIVIDDGRAGWVAASLLEPAT